VGTITLGVSGKPQIIEATLFKHLPRFIVTPLRGDYYLFILNPALRSIDRQRLDWFKVGYDSDRQGIATAVAVPKSNFVLFAVQKSGEVIVYDIVARKIVRRFLLEESPDFRPGTPQFEFDASGKKLRVLCYDTLYLLSRHNWRVEKTLRLTESTDRLAFVGDFSTISEAGLSAIPRPYSRDVVVVDMNRLEVKDRVTVGGQPIQAALMSNGQILARDWHSGR